MKEDLVRKVMREMGSRGGKKRMDALTPAERTALAKKAAARSVESRKKKAVTKKARKPKA